MKIKFLLKRSQNLQIILPLNHNLSDASLAYTANRVISFTSGKILGPKQFVIPGKTGGKLGDYFA